jgi:nucleolar protein 14
LLKEYKASKRTNSFVDKRFGESDPTMSLEEKMFLRFQKEKIIKARKSGMYNLDEKSDDEEVLTHKGQALGASNLTDADAFSDEEEDAALGREIVDSLHFGGGFLQKVYNSRSASLLVPLPILTD